MGCLAAKPIVNGIEKDLRGKATVVRLNLLSEVGREAAARYRVSAVPTMLVLGAGGEVTYRKVGTPDREAIVAEATAPREPFAPRAD